MTAALSIRRAHVFTGSLAHPSADAVTVGRDGRVASLAYDPGAEIVLDAAGATVAPGLIDAHVHLLLGGRTLREIDLSGVRSREAFESAIAAAHGGLAEGAWLVARGWSQEHWGGSPMPDKSWLAAAGTRPVVCHRVDLHAALVNDAVLAKLDLSERATQAWGSLVRRDARGAPTGLLLEGAAWELVNPLVAVPSPEDDRSALLAAQALAHERGLTAVGAMEYRRVIDEVYVPLRDCLTLRCRVTLLDRGWPMGFDDARSFAGDDHLSIAGCKAFLDGTMGSRTAALLEEYADDPGNRGVLVELARDGHLLDWARACAKAGLSPSMHAIGDRAARLALDVIEALPPRDAGRPLGPEGRRERTSAPPRIEHAQQIDRADLPRFRGVTVSMQPAHKADDGPFLLARVGRERLAGSFAFRSLRSAGAHLAFGSDWPVATLDPLAGIRAAVTGLTSDGAILRPEENLTVAEALHAYTAGAARALGLGGAGLLEPGSWGDLVLFDRDALAADWTRDPPRIVLTAVGGEIVHPSPPRAPARSRL